MPAECQVYGDEGIRNRVRYVRRFGPRGVTHFGEKSPEHQRYLPDVGRVLPGAKVVLLYRDGRDVAHSLTKLAWMSDDVYVNFALWLYYYRIQRRADSILKGETPRKSKRRNEDEDVYRDRDDQTQFVGEVSKWIVDGG